MRAFLSDGLARLNRVHNEVLTMDGLGATLDAYGKSIARATPALWEELCAMAEAAGLSLAEAVLLQTRREIMGYTRFPTAGDCTSMVRATAGEAVLAQTVDLNCEMQDHLTLTRIAGPDIAGGSALVFGFTGLLGYLGMNAAGLSVGLNLVLAGDWHPGVPPYLAIRHLIDRAENVAQAIDILSALPLASSRNFVLCDRHEAAMVEATAGRMRVLRGASLCHANHFVHPEFVPSDGINVFSRNSSNQRQAAAEALLARHSCTLTPEAVMTAFSAAPINVSGPRDMRRERTVAAVVMEPRLGRFSLRRGDPARTATEVHTLCGPKGAQA